MANVKILIKGYAQKSGSGWKANGTTCLVTTGDTKIITDPGCNRARLLEALESEGLKTGDIDYVFLSHQHPDHTLLAGVFENAKAITFDMNFIYDNDVLTEFSPHELGDEIEIIQTPGHVLEHISLVVSTDKGKVGIAGDCIFWLDNEEQVFDVHQPDPAQAKGLNMDALVESRKKLIERCDYIIPGHGKMFTVEK